MYSLRAFVKEVDWNKVSKRTGLTEDFIREFKDVLNWTYISKYQKLSEAFITEFQDYVDWWVVMRPDREYSDDFCDLHYDRLKNI